MKTLKLTLAVIALLFVGIAAQAAIKTASDKPTKSDVVNIYIDAITKGTTKNLDKILDNDMQFNMQRGQRVNTLDKNTWLDLMGKTAVSAEPVNTTTTVLQDDDNTEKVKIEFKYPDFTRVDVATLNYSFGWAITNITSTFK
jgi:hypothetical protein